MSWQIFLSSLKPSTKDQEEEKKGRQGCEFLQWNRDSK